MFDWQSVIISAIVPLIIYVVGIISSHQMAKRTVASQIAKTKSEATLNDASGDKARAEAELIEAQRDDVVVGTQDKLIIGLRRELHTERENRIRDTAALEKKLDTERDARRQASQSHAKEIEAEREARRLAVEAEREARRADANNCADEIAKRDTKINELHLKFATYQDQSETKIRELQAANNMVGTKMARIEDYIFEKWGEKVSTKELIKTPPTPHEIPKQDGQE